MKQKQLLKELKGKSVEIASDMRVDSPGHCGLLGAGSTLDVDKNVIVDTQIIKSTEVKNSNAMELESLKGNLFSLKRLKQRSRSLSQTDIAKYQPTWLKKNPISSILMMSGIWQKGPSSCGNVYNVYISSGEKKLLKAAKTKKFKTMKPWIGSIINNIYWVASSTQNENEREEKWLSLLNHIINLHAPEGFNYFKKCTVPQPSNLSTTV